MPLAPRCRVAVERFPFPGRLRGARPATPAQERSELRAQGRAIALSFRPPSSRNAWRSGGDTSRVLARCFPRGDSSHLSSSRRCSSEATRQVRYIEKSIVAPSDVAHSANYNPKALQLDPEGNVNVHTGPVVTSFFGMLRRVYRIEVSAS